MANSAQIQFLNDQVTNLNGNLQPITVTISGTLTVNYADNGDVTSVAGTLTVADANGSEVFGPFSGIRNNNNNVYLLSASGQADPLHDALLFQYQGEQPATVTNLDVSKGGNSYNTVANEPVISMPVCFVTGTHIRTTRGECAVEDLVVGDVAVTASGETRPIVWIGHRDNDCRRQRDLHPIRVAAHAFGASLPERDLWLSPGHPVLVCADANNEGGHLVPIMCLVNGTTIASVSVNHVTYWHVELDEHDILFAEGLPTESYLDWGDRGFFAECADHALRNPDFIVPGLAGRCRPVAIDGPVVEAERQRLDGMFAMRLATMSAWPSEDVLTAF